MRAWFVVPILLLACGDDVAQQPTVNPTQADGGDVEEDFSAGVSIQCPALDPRVDIVRTAVDDLDDKGGAIPDGRYVLTASNLVDDELEPDAGTSVIGQKAAALAFAGNEVAWASDTDVFGTPKNDCCRGRYTIEENEVTLEVRCNDGNEVFTLPYGVDGPTLRLRTTGNEYVDTYAKR